MWFGAFHLWIHWWNCCCSALQATGWRWRGIPSSTTGGGDCWPHHQTMTRRRRTVPSQVCCMTTMWTNYNRKSIHSQIADFFRFISSSHIILQHLSGLFVVREQALMLLILCLPWACNCESCEFVTVGAMALKKSSALVSRLQHWHFKKWHMWGKRWWSDVSYPKAMEVTEGVDPCDFLWLPKQHRLPTNTFPCS